jgi:hypothetical protein
VVAALCTLLSPSLLLVFVVVVVVVVRVLYAEYTGEVMVEVLVSM